jgi:hypothetical protein
MLAGVVRQHLVQENADIVPDRRPFDLEPGILLELRPVPGRAVGHAQDAHDVIGRRRRFGAAAGAGEQALPRGSGRQRPPGAHHEAPPVETAPGQG